jgi:hypothetical protein
MMQTEDRRRVAAAPKDRDLCNQGAFNMTDPLPADLLADPAATASAHSGLRHAPASVRNREPIRQALASLLPERPLTVLEIASGSGEHALWMARSLPNVTWMTSEATQEGLAAIEAWRGLFPELAGRVPSPVLIDAASPPWPGLVVDAIFVANMTHISPWDATRGLFEGAQARLATGGLLLIYGPFNEGGESTGAGNAAFDTELRLRNAQWGLRDREAMDAEAAAQGFAIAPCRTMPADNRLLVYRRS